MRASACSSRVSRPDDDDSCPGSSSAASRPGWPFWSVSIATVAWNDSGDVRAFAAPQAEGHPGTHGGDTLREDKMGVFTRGSRPLA